MGKVALLVGLGSRIHAITLVPTSSLPPAPPRPLRSTACTKAADVEFHPPHPRDPRYLHHIVAVCSVSMSHAHLTFHLFSTFTWGSRVRSGLVSGARGCGYTIVVIRYDGDDFRVPLSLPLLSRIIFLIPALSLSFHSSLPSMIAMALVPQARLLLRRRGPPDAPPSKLE